MRSARSPLGSRVAKRILVCFLIGAVLPTAGLALYAYHAVASHSEEDTKQYLRRELRAIRMGVLDRLLVHEEILEHRLKSLGFPGLPAEAPSLSGATPAVRAFDPPRGFRRLLAVRVTPMLRESWEATASPVRRAATAMLNRNADDADDAYDADGFSLVTVPVPSAKRAMVFMSTVDADASGAASVWLAEIAPESLWGHLSAEQLSSLKVRIYDDEDRLLYSSEERAEDPVSPGRDPGHAPAVSGELFLQPVFGCKGWRFVIEEGRALSSASLREFEIILPLAFALTLSVVVLLSLHLIRRILGPLAHLRDAAHRLSNGELDARVEVSSRDELQELGNLMNRMAGRLSRHLRLIETAAQIDHATLSNLQTDRTAYHVLEGICNYIRADQAAMLLFEDPEDRRIRFHVHRHTASENDDRIGSRVCRGGFRDWLMGVSHSRARRFVDLPNEVKQLFGGPCEEVVCTPVTRGSVQTGVVVAVAPEVEDLEERLQELDRLVTRIDVALHNAGLVDRVTRLREETVEALARAIDATSSWTGGHSKRVTGLALALGRRLELEESSLDRLYRGGMLHDVGKLGVPRGILDKPGKLTDEEFAELKRHPALGATILGPLSVFRDVLPLIEQHHERFDGQGYPEGLVGTEIVLEARILAVADVFDALISDRPYREALPLRMVVEIIQRDAGSHFDPHVVESFMDLYRHNELPQDSVQELERSAGSALEPAVMGEG